MRFEVSYFFLADRRTDSFVCESTKNWCYYIGSQITHCVDGPFQTMVTINLWSVLTQFVMSFLTITFNYSQTPIIRHPHLAPMEVCEQKFHAIPYFDLLPRLINCHKMRCANSGAMLGFVFVSPPISCGSWLLGFRRRSTFSKHYSIPRA
jgi:hypothetical protein